MPRLLCFHLLASIVCGGADTLCLLFPPRTYGLTIRKSSTCRCSSFGGASLQFPHFLHSVVGLPALMLRCFQRGFRRPLLLLSGSLRGSQFFSSGLASRCQLSKRSIRFCLGLLGGRFCPLGPRPGFLSGSSLAFELRQALPRLFPRGAGFFYLLRQGCHGLLVAATRCLKQSSLSS